MAQMSSARRWWMGLLVVGLAACSQRPPATAGPSPVTTRVENVTAPTATVTVTATPAPPTATPEPLAARVNGQPILLSAYERELARCQASGAADCPNRVLQSLEAAAVVDQAAEASGLAVSDAEVEAALAANQPADLAGWLSANLYTEAELREALRQELLRAKAADLATANLGTTAEQVHAQMILVADEATAQNLLGQLQAGADFSTLALQYSLDLSSRAAGGDLGWFPRGLLTVPEVETAAFALQPGEISSVISSTLGYHIVQVIERDPNRPLSQTATQALRAQAYAQWLARLLAQAAIETFVKP